MRAPVASKPCGRTSCAVLLYGTVAELARRAYCSTACANTCRAHGAAATLAPRPYTPSPSNNLHHRRIQQQQLEIIREYLASQKGQTMPTITRIAMVFLLLAGLSVPARAQSLSEACNPAVGPFVVTSAKPYTITWVMDATAPASPTDPTLVPERVNGFTVAVDGGASVDITPTAGSPCSTGTAGANAGKIPYLFVMPSGVAKGAHSVSLTPWNFVLNPDGTPTTTRAMGAPAVIPFSAADLVKTGPPLSPKNPKVWK